MGSRKKKEQPVQVAAPDTTAIQQQYQASLQQIQQQSATAFQEISKANQTTVQALNNQLAESQKLNASYQDKLNAYLSQVQQSQLEQTKALAERDAVATRQQELTQSDAEANNLVNNLYANNQIANSQFRQKTSRRRGFIA